jgi:hypothetical protein
LNDSAGEKVISTLRGNISISTHCYSSAGEIEKTIKARVDIWIFE